MLDPQSKNLTIPRGVVLFAPFLPGTQLPGPYGDLGNCPEFTLSRATNFLTHHSSRGGLSYKDEEIPINSDMSGAVTCDDLKPENIQRWFMGTSARVTVASASGQTETITSAQLGGIYQIGRSTVSPMGLRNITGLTITGAVEFQDYTFDAPTGLLTILPGATGITQGGNINLTYGVAASTYTQIESGDTSQEGELKFVSQNPIGPNRVIMIPRARISPTGDWSQMTDGESPTWAQIQFSISVLKKGTMALAYNADGLPATT